MRITETAIRETALQMVRDHGAQALNARALAAALGCSTQPIFKNFPSMEALRRAVVEDALAAYHRFVEAAVAASPHPPYKARGLAYIGFARAEPALFRLLFMRSRAGETESPEDADWISDTARASTTTGLAGSEAALFHLEMWAMVHGIAVMLATGYLTLDEETVSRMLTDVFRGTKARWEKEL
ncbi:MAG: WHG domain-containing protein [Oscillospiraceae bacterium]|nr:WHG domain-containing protein [Oscillospiraceae bacterium]